MEWKVLDDEPLPVVKPEETQLPRLTRRRWVASGLLAILLLAGGLWAVKERGRLNEAQLQKDVAEAVTIEESALRFGLVEQARDLADPNALEEWQLRYAALFRHPLVGNEPAIRSIDYAGGVALVTLDHEVRDTKWQSTRAYRLVDTQWRRSPVPAERWGTPVAYHSTHFTVWLSEQDVPALPPDELLAFLEEFYSGFVEQWFPVDHARLTLRVEPHDLMPAALAVSNASDEIVLTSPKLFLRAEFPFLLPPRAYRLAVAQSIAEALDHPSTSPSDMSIEDVALRQQLRSALVRHLVLTEEEEQQYREFVRAGADEVTLDPSFKETLDRTTFTFLVDYLIALEGQSAPRRLARAVEQSVGLDHATIQAFGLPLESLLLEVRVWNESKPVAKESSK